MPPPDAVRLVAEYLRAQDHLAGVTVVTGVAGHPEDRPESMPLLLVESIDESPPSRLPWARTRRTRIGIQAWATPGADEALRILRGALAALYSARAVVMPDGARIDRVEAGAEPTEVPIVPATSDAHRAVATVEVTFR